MPALPTDLVDLATVELFLGLTPGNADESRLLSLINALSDYLVQICNRDFALQYVSELRNGTGQYAMMVLQPPIVQVYAVDFLGTAMQLAASDTVSGVVWDTEKIQLRGAASVMSSVLYTNRYPSGMRNIRINYLSGWQLPNQGTADWQANTNYYPRATIKPTSNNAGGFIYSYQVRKTGNAAASGSSRPSFNQSVGGTTTDGAVTWTNLGITQMPDALPYSFREACAEIVATRYRQQSRWADTGTGVGPERVNYFIKDMSDSAANIVQTMKNLNPVLP